MNPIEAIERIIESPYRIATLSTPDPERAGRLFEMFTLHTGRAAYAWSPTEGLRRIAGAYEPIPGTARLADALAYIASTIHFGLYVIPVDREPLDSPAIEERLWRIAQATERARRLVVLMGADPALPARLRPFAVRIVHGAARGQAAQTTAARRRRSVDG